MPLFGQKQSSNSAPDPKEVLDAFAEFVQASDWGRSFEILEARQYTLLNLGARLILIQTVAEPDDKKMRQQLAMHLMLLEIAAHDGIAAARKMVEDAAQAGRQQQAQGQSRPAEVDLMSTMTTGGYGSGAPSGSGSGSRSSGSPADADLERMLAHLSPEERRAVIEALRNAQGGRN